MSQTATSIFAVLAFLLAAFAAYTAQANDNKYKGLNPVAILDVAAINTVYAQSASEEEVDMKYRIITTQIKELGAAGYVVISTQGKVLSYPEDIRLTPEMLGVSSNDES